MKNKTLCHWNKIEIKENKELLFSIIKNPKYYCKKCIRVSNDEKLICKAEKIK